MTKTWGQKELLRWNKKHFSSFLKGFQLSEIVLDLRVCLENDAYNIWQNIFFFHVGVCSYPIHQIIYLKCRSTDKHWKFWKSTKSSKSIASKYFRYYEIFYKIFFLLLKVTFYTAQNFFILTTKLNPAHTPTEIKQNLLHVFF